MFGKDTSNGHIEELDDEQPEGKIVDETGTTRRNVLQALVAGALAPPAVGQLHEVSASTTSGIGRDGGPVVLSGFDPEHRYRHSGSHGHPDDHAALLRSVLNEVTNGGEGVLVLGASHSRGTWFWEDKMGPRLDEEVTTVSGAENIRNVDFNGYAMIAVASTDGYVKNGATLTDEENEAVIDRRDDIAEFVNDGGGLVGKSQDPQGLLERPWEYVDPLGEFELAYPGYRNIQVTEMGKDLGLTQSGMDMCCYHDVFLEFPDDIFDVLVTYDEGGTYQGKPALLGGFEVELQPEVELTIEGPNAVEVGSTLGYDLGLTNVGDKLPEPVKIRFTITREGGIEQDDFSLTYDGEALGLTYDEDEEALIGRLPEELDIGADYEEAFEVAATFAEEGIASRQFTIAAELVGVGDEQDTYAGGDITVLTSWRVAKGAPVRASPVYHDGHVYVGADNGAVCAFDHQSGEELWCRNIGGPICASPTLRDGWLYVGSTNGHLCRLDAATGEVDWDIELDAGIYSSPSLVYGMLYVGTASGHLCALDPATGALIWDRELGGTIRSSPTVVDGTVFIGGENDDDGHVCAFDAVTGDLLWAYETGGAVRSSPTYSDETVSDGLVCVGSDDGTLYCLHAGDGSVRWTVGAGGAIRSSPTIADGVVFVGSNDGQCYAVGVDGGEHAWDYDDEEVPDPAEAVRSSPTVAGGFVYFGADDGLVYAVTEARGRIVWGFDTGDPIGICSPTIAAGNLFIGTEGGNVYGVDAGVDEDERGRGSRTRLGTVGGHDDPQPRPLFQVDIVGTNASLDDGWLLCEIDVENIGDGVDTQSVELFMECDDGAPTLVASTELELDAKEETTVTLESDDVHFPEDVEECVAIVECDDDSDRTEVAVVKCCELKAGQDIPVGEVCIEPEGDVLRVVYRTEDGWELTETHAALGDDLDEYRDEGWLKGPDNPAPGQFPYSSDESGTEVTLEASLEDYRTASDDLVVATHAVVEHDDHGTESAWCGKERFTDRGNWATYWTYPVWWRTDDGDDSDEEESEDDDGNGDDSSPGNGDGNGPGNDSSPGNGGGNGRGNGGGNGRGNGGGNGR